MSKSELESTAQGNLLSAAGELMRHGIQVHTRRLLFDDHYLYPYLDAYGLGEKTTKHVRIRLWTIEPFCPLRIEQSAWNKSADLLLVHRRSHSQADWWFYVTARQMEELLEATKLGAPILLPPEKRKVFRLQSVEALASYLRGEAEAEIVLPVSKELSVLDSDAIQRKALEHVVNTLGMAIGVEKPLRRSGRWIIRLITQDNREVGELQYEESGELIFQKFEYGIREQEETYAESAIRSAA